MRRLIFARRARSDLVSIRAYIAADSPVAAERVSARLSSACASLCDFPLSGRPGLEKGTRELVTVRPYIIVYTVTDARVIVASIFHGAQDRSDAADG